MTNHGEDLTPLDNCLQGLERLGIDMKRLRLEEEYEEKRGGSSDVRVATLDSESLAPKLVVTKTIRLRALHKEPHRLAFRLARELKVWARLKHPHVLPLLGYYLPTDYNLAVLISDYMAYGNLAEYIEQEKPSWDSLLLIVRDSADGLAYLHRREPAILHGDLKPGNVLINAERRALLADFGLSRALEEAPSGRSTNRGLKETLRYLGPELVKEMDKPHSLASDVWAWACLVLEVLTGTIPYAEKKTEHLVMRALVNDELPADIESLPIPIPDLKSLLAECWAIQPNERPSAPFCLRILNSQVFTLLTPNHVEHFSVAVEPPPAPIPPALETYNDQIPALPPTATTLPNYETTPATPSSSTSRTRSQPDMSARLPPADLRAQEPRSLAPASSLTSEADPPPNQDPVRREVLEKLMPKVEDHKSAPEPAEVTQAEVTETVGARWNDPFRVRWKKTLPEYHIPDHIFDLVAGQSSKGLLDKVKQTLMPRQFHLKTFGQFWQNLIFLEELQQREDLRRYSMEAVSVTLTGGLYFCKFPHLFDLDQIQVPGLEWKSPLVIVGDLIKIRLHGETKVTHEGYVHKLKKSGVLLSLHQDFPYKRHLTYDVEFTLNRLPFRIQHDAVQKQDTTKKRFLFPEWKDVTAVRPSIAYKVHFSPLNRFIGGNEPQEMAISRILSMAPGSAPFIIHGPFGTGKTTTLVEAIQQLYARDNNVRILACAPSNSAADNIATRLQNIRKSDLLRLNAVAREYETIQPSNLKLFHANFGLLGPDPGGDGMRFRYPDYKTLLKYKIIVTTCVTAGVPAGLGLNPGHFDWIFVDEAGQVAEPEVLIPILKLANHNTNLILCGDLHQLGPIIQSTISKSLGHSKSYLLRLMEMEMYNEKGTMGQPNVTIVTLRRNFRNNPAILQFPNIQFYSGAVEAGGDSMITTRLVGWYKMANPNFPIKFRGIVGRDQRENKSLSWFNAHEVLEVKNLVEEIISSVRMGFKPKDIGIIAAFSAQCTKIKAILDSGRYKDIKVGLVEEFQGREWPIIIISTTRSSSKNLAFDLKHNVGFVASPRRLNFAVTRAQAGLFIFGNPHTLSLDPLWRTLLNYIRRNKGYTGPPLDPRWDANEEVDFTVPDFYDPKRQQEHASNMELLERRIRRTVLRQQGLEAEERDSDEEDEVVYVSKMEGEGAGRANDI